MVHNHKHTCKVGLLFAVQHVCTGNSSTPTPTPLHVHYDKWWNTMFKFIVAQWYVIAIVVGLLFCMCCFFIYRRRRANSMKSSKTTRGGGGGAETIRRSNTSTISSSRYAFLQDEANIDAQKKELLKFDHGLGGTMRIS
jgi:flagellar biosynthesis/type III secretory pathway M-ring protein FliF/YscJ